MKESNEVRVKDEPICDSQWISQTSEAKRQSIDNEIQTSKYQVEVKVEEKFTATEEFANRASIAFLNEETTSDNNPINNQTTKISDKRRKRKTNKLQKSK